MMVSKQQVQTTIQEFLMTRGVAVDDVTIAEYDFLSAGALDSFETLSLMMQLESDYNITISPELLLEPSNAKVGNLAEAIMSLINDSNKS